MSEKICPVCGKMIYTPETSSLDGLSCRGSFDACVGVASLCKDNKECLNNTFGTNSACLKVKSSECLSKANVDGLCNSCHKCASKPGFPSPTCTLKCIQCSYASTAPDFIPFWEGKRRPRWFLVTRAHVPLFNPFLPTNKIATYQPQAHGIQPNCHICMLCRTTPYGGMTAYQCGQHCTGCY